MKFNKSMTRAMNMFDGINSALMDLQVQLCTAKQTPRADQVDILRRALLVVCDEIVIAEKYKVK